MLEKSAFNTRLILLLTSLLILFSLCSCAHDHTPPQPKSSRPVQVPAPPPQMFSRCLREILLNGQASVPISDPCLTFLRSERTK